MDRTDEDRAATTKGRIVHVGEASYVDGVPTLKHWIVSGGPYGARFPVVGPDDPCVGGWTFRELHAIANGVGGDVEQVDSWPDSAANLSAYTIGLG